MNYSLRNHLPSSLVEEIDAKYSSEVISTTLRFRYSGTYEVVGGQVGCKDDNGYDTFVQGRVCSKTVIISQPQTLRINLPVSLSSGEWAVGVFHDKERVPYSSSILAVVSTETLCWSIAGLALILLTFSSLLVYDSNSPVPSTTTPGVETTEETLRRVYDSQNIPYDDELIREDAQAIKEIAREIGQ